MVHFIWTLRVQLLLYTVVLAAIYPYQGQPRKDNLISSFLQKFLKPFVRSTNLFHFLDTNSTNLRATETMTKIEKIIRKKVDELKPLLQDNDETKVETDDNLTLRGTDETTVVEFLPKAMKKYKNDIENAMLRSETTQDPVKININKYKLLRGQIKVMLDEENISEGTKSLIIKTLDEMIAQMIESHCTWNTAGRRLFDSLNDTSVAISKVHSMTRKEWLNLRQEYLDYLKNRKENENAFMHQFHEFFSTVINDTYNLSGRYKIKCQLVEIEKPKKNKTEKLSLRDDLNSKIKCDQFKLCSEELREFFLDLYNYLNDTTVSTFRNYAAMYIRDVNVDFGLDKSVVVSVVNDLGHDAEHKVKKVFKKEIRKFDLHPKKSKSHNIKILSQFIKATILGVKTIVGENLVNELKAKKTKLFLTVKEDLGVNLDVDLENLEQHYLNSICSTFVLCNGRYANRRSGQPWSFRPKTNDGVYVKVQLSLDDEMKDTMMRSGLLKALEKPGRMKYKIAKHKMQSIANNITLTRTTTVSTTAVTTETSTTTTTTPTTTTALPRMTHLIPIEEPIWT